MFHQRSPEKHPIRRGSAASITETKEEELLSFIERALNGYFISSAVGPCSFCDSPCIIPHWSPPFPSLTLRSTIPRAVVRGHVALWIALPARGAPFPRNKAGDSMEKKKEGGRRWFPRTRGMAGSLHRHRRGVLPD